MHICVLGVKIYMAAPACFSVHSGIQCKLIRSYLSATPVEVGVGKSCMASLPDSPSRARDESRTESNGAREIRKMAGPCS